MSKDVLFGLTAAFGATCLEILQWAELRKKISVKEKKILFSKYYWILTTLMIVISGVGTYIVFFEDKIQLKIPFFLGAAFPTIFKKAVNLSQSKSLPKLGEESKITFGKVAAKYFQ